jgi:hypothetical protein
VRGSGIQLTAVDLPAIEGGNAIQLPVALAADDIWVYASQESSMRGLAIAWDDFEIREDNDETVLTYRGRILARELECYGRNKWDLEQWYWTLLIKEFMAQLHDSSQPDHSPYFPRWLGNKTDLEPEPQVTIGPDPRGVGYHWHDWSQPVYVPHPNDQALVWDLVEWTDDP